MLVSDTTIEPTDFQKAVLAFRGTCNIANLGGRGSGKSVSLLFDVLSHTSDFAATARPLVMRESHAGLLELFNEAYELCIAAFGSVQRNKSDMTLTCPNGAVIQFTNIGDEASYAKLQGRTFTALYADEAGNYSPTAWAFMMRSRSNLRVPPGRRAHVHITGNPGGKSHSKVLKTFVNRSAPWVPWTDEHGQLWVWVSSNLQQNPHLDRDQYAAQLRASTDGNTALLDAWLAGTWTSFGGNMFDAYDPATHMLPVAPPAMRANYRYVIGADWGTASPSVAILFGQLRNPISYFTPSHPQGFRLPVGTIIALDETSTLASWDDLSVGTGAPPVAWADMIKEMAKRNGLRNCPQVVQDDAKGLQSETVIQLLREAGVPATKPFRKDRRGTWALMRQLLSCAVTGDGPGLYLTPACRYLATTLPEAPRGPLNPEDLDHRWSEDHALDAAGYGIRHFKTAIGKTGRTIGDY
ncbi:hypothetical protein GC209_13940 [bacterium]|nr:hypothetical protein [bacterium]